MWITVEWDGLSKRTIKTLSTRTVGDTVRGFGSHYDNALPSLDGRSILWKGMEVSVTDRIGDLPGITNGLDSSLRIRERLRGGMQSQSTIQAIKTNRPASHGGDDPTRKKRRGQDFGQDENVRNCCFCDTPVGPDEGTTWGGCKKHYVHFHCIRGSRAGDLYAALSHLEAIADLGPLGDQLCFSCMATNKTERR